MKKYLIFTILLVCSAALLAQVPHSFQYQAVVRDADGAIIADQEMSFEIAILRGNSSGDLVYAEQHTKSTNQFGLVTLGIGMGNVLAGDFTSIDWGSDKYFLMIEIDGVYLGTTQLLSVPYALHSLTVSEDRFEDEDCDTLNEIQTLSMSNDTLTLSKGGGSIRLPVLSASGTGLWGKSGSSIYYNEGKVGIGTATPPYYLTVSGDPHGLMGIMGKQDAILYLSKGSTDKSATLAFMDVDFYKFWVGMHLNNNFQITSTFGSLTGLEVTSEGNTKISGNQSIGGNMFLNGKLGIGTDTPDYSLDLIGQLNIKAKSSGDKAIFVNSKEALWYGGTYFSWGFGGSYNYFSRPLTIGTNADPGGYLLVVKGDAAKSGGGSWATWSDARLKNIHGDYQKGLKEITELQPVSFSYKENNTLSLPCEQDYV
ncbi:MAG: hypothetical protein ACP5E3_06475, partial [Bacteroidales bacterium]